MPTWKEIIGRTLLGMGILFCCLAGILGILLCLWAVLALGAFLYEYFPYSLLLLVLPPVCYIVGLLAERWE